MPLVDRAAEAVIVAPRWARVIGWAEQLQVVVCVTEYLASTGAYATFVTVSPKCHPDG